MPMLFDLLFTLGLLGEFNRRFDTRTPWQKFRDKTIGWLALLIVLTFFAFCAIGGFLLLKRLCWF